MNNAQLCQYIWNTQQVPLLISDFDDDWEPAGEFYRETLVEAELITIEEPDEATQTMGGIRLTEAGLALVDRGHRT